MGSIAPIFARSIITLCRHPIISPRLRHTLARIGRAVSPREDGRLESGTSLG